MPLLLNRPETLHAPQCHCHMCVMTLPVQITAADDTGGKNLRRSDCDSEMFAH
jgi:hypothetical protein